MGAVIARVFTSAWIRFWMLFAGRSLCGRIACTMAGWVVPPHFGRLRLVGRSRKGFTALSARIAHADFRSGLSPLIDERVLIMDNGPGGTVVLGDHVRLCRDTLLETGPGTTIALGDQTFVQPRCQFSAHMASIRIGRRVQIAASCAFYSYDHGLGPDRPIWDQPLTTRGDIEIGDDAWLGHGVIVLSGVRIGKGATIGAGAIVTRDVPDMAIAVGNPARVVATRGTAPVSLARTVA